MKQNVVIELEGPDDSVKNVVDEIFIAFIQKMQTGIFNNFTIYKKEIVKEPERIQLPVDKPKKMTGGV